MSCVRRRPISCFIIAKNEADRIVRTITAVRPLVEEIVVVDSGSSDETPELARQAGARVIYNAWAGFGQQKRFAEMQCRHDWLLNVDADEVIPGALAHEIAAAFRDGEPKFPAYAVPVNFVYPSQDRPRRWARDHYCIRLYDRRRVRFRNSAIHDSVDAAHVEVGHFKSAISHFSFRSLSDLIRKCDERALYNAQQSEPKSLFSLLCRCVSEFPVNFLKYYFWRCHFTGGLPGLSYATIFAYYRLVRIWRCLNLVSGSRQSIPDSAAAQRSI